VNEGAVYSTERGKYGKTWVHVEIAVTMVDILFPEDDYQNLRTAARKWIGDSALIPRAIEEYIEHKLGHHKVYQRKSDKYFFGTHICKITDKRWNDFLEVPQTKEFINYTLVSC
jgi:hypothetical protein